MDTSSQCPMQSDVVQAHGWDGIKAQVRWGGLIAAALSVGIVALSLAAGQSAGVLVRSASGGDALSSATAGVTFLLGMQASMIVQALLAISLEARSVIRRLGLSRNHVTWSAVAGAALGGLLLTGLYTLVGVLAGWSDLQRDLAPFAALLHSPQWSLALLVVVVGAPVSEELLFRGLLFPALAGRWLRLPGAALVSTLTWTSLHAGYSISGLIEVLLFGLYFCWLLRRTGSLLVPIVCHSVVNAVTLMFVAIYL